MAMTPIQKARAVSEAQTTLGVSNHATEEEIHSAWKRLAFKLHPDRGASDSQAMAKVNAAYSLLKDRTKSLVTGDAAEADNSTQAPSSVRPVRPRSVRPSMPLKVVDIDSAMVEECSLLVSDEQAGHGHVATKIERIGRKMTFIVDTELAEGVNRVAMPVSEHADGRHAKADSIAFRSNKAGPGTLELPESVREKKFPGTTSVSFRFAK